MITQQLLSTAIGRAKQLASGQRKRVFVVPKKDGLQVTTEFKSDWLFEVYPAGRTSISSAGQALAAQLGML